MMKLIKYDAACKAIAAARSVDEVKNIRDISVAMKHYAKQAGNEEMEADAVEIRMRATRGLDAMRKKQKETIGLALGRAFGVGKKQAKSRGLKNNPREKDSRPTLSEAGINKNLANEGRRLGKLSEREFEDSIKVARASVAKAVNAAVKTEQKAVKIKNARSAFESRRDKGAKLADLNALIESGQRFPVLYADPPWEFKVYSGKGKQRSAERHYDVASLADIAALPIGKLATDNAALLMWAVWPELPGALEVIKAWGFEFKTAGFVWVKTVSETNPAFHTGMGYWTRANTEVCLLATRGSPQRDKKDVHQVIMAPVGEHSVKPEEIAKRIERLLIGPYFEAFGRRARPGWTVWGNELEQHEVANDKDGA